MRKNKRVVFTAVILIMSVILSLSVNVSAANTNYVKQSKIVSGGAYLFVADVGGEAAYTYGMSKNKVAVSTDGDYLSVSSSASDYEIVTESAGGSSYYLRNADGEYICFEYRSTSVTVYKYEDGEKHEVETYTSDEEFSLVNSRKKLNTTTSSQSESSSQDDTETVITTTTSYSPVWKCQGSGSCSFSSSVSVDGESFKRYLTINSSGLDVDPEKTVFSLFGAGSEYTVSFDGNGGSGAPGDITVIDGQKISQPSSSPVRTGYSFAGWSESKSGGEYSFSSPVTGDITLYAQWTPNSYTVNFNPNGGTGSMDSQSFEYDEYQRLNKNTFARAEYKFSGWAETASGTALYGDGESVKNLTGSDGAKVELYAVWEKSDETVPEDNKDDQDGETGKYTLTIRYVDEKNKDIAYSEQRIVADGEEYTVVPVDIDGYTPLKTEYTGIIKGGDMTVEVTYKSEGNSGGIWWIICIIVLALLCAGGVAVLIVRYKKGKLDK